MSEDSKAALAKKMSQQKAQQSGRKPLNNNALKPKEGMSFFGEEADGFNMSPKAILLFSVAYMGCVILLHIFGKISSLKTGAANVTMDPTDAGSAGDL